MPVSQGSHWTFGAFRGDPQANRSPVRTQTTDPQAFVAPHELPGQISPVQFAGPRSPGSYGTPYSAQTAPRFGHSTAAKDEPQLEPWMGSYQLSPSEVRVSPSGWSVAKYEEPVISPARDQPFAKPRPPPPPLPELPPPRLETLDIRYVVGPQILSKAADTAQPGESLRKPPPIAGVAAGKTRSSLAPPHRTISLRCGQSSGRRSVSMLALGSAAIPSPCRGRLGMGRTRLRTPQGTHPQNVASLPAQRQQSMPRRSQWLQAL